MKLLVANWKMNPQTFEHAENLALASIKCARENQVAKIVLCAPFPWLMDLSHVYAKQIAFGAQDIFWHEKGAYTGEVSPLMLKNSKVKYVIIGHSERRKWLGETDEMINKKVRAAIAAGLKVILCIGEPKDVRKHGLSAAKKFVADQLKKDLRGIGNLKLEIGNLTIAYEPIWAIGTGAPDKPEDSAEMAKFIKSKIRNQKLQVIYGGSVTSKNAPKFLKHKEISGALVGGASLDPKEFKIIAEIAARAAK